MSERDFYTLIRGGHICCGKKEAVTYFGSKRGGHGPKFDNLFLI